MILLINKMGLKLSTKNNANAKKTNQVANCSTSIRRAKALPIRLRDLVIIILTLLSTMIDINIIKNGEYP